MGNDQSATDLLCRSKCRWHGRRLIFQPALPGVGTRPGEVRARGRLRCTDSPRLAIRSRRRADLGHGTALRISGPTELLKALQRTGFRRRDPETAINRRKTARGC